MSGVVLARAPSGARYILGDRDQRPWGSWEVVSVGPGYTLKRIEVSAGKRLSLQYHEFRSEHWMIVEGAAEVEINGDIKKVIAGDHVFIPLRAPHRISNVGTTPMSFIEVQLGDVLDESDIVRISDDYGRT